MCFMVNNGVLAMFLNLVEWSLLLDKMLAGSWILNLMMFYYAVGRKMRCLMRIAVVNSWQLPMFLNLMLTRGKMCRILNLE